MKRFICVCMALIVSSCYCLMASPKGDYMSGREAFYKNEYEAALRFYVNAISQDENYVDAYCGKGEAEIGLKKYDDAISTYTKAIEIDENKIDAYIGRAVAYGLKPMPNLTLAKNDLDKAIEIDSTNATAFQARAMVNYSLNDKKSAYIDINHAIELAPNNPHAYGIKAMLEFGDFQFANAMRSFEKYHEINKIKKEEENAKTPVEPKLEQGYEEVL